MAPSPDQIFRAKLQLELEPADNVIRHLLARSPGTNTFVFLRTVGDQFWNNPQLFKSLEIIHQWCQHLGVPEDFPTIKRHIWENFLCRLSLDARYIIDRKSHGNKVLTILVDTVETTLFSTLSVATLAIDRSREDIVDSLQDFRRMDFLDRPVSRPQQQPTDLFGRDMRSQQTDYVRGQGSSTRPQQPQLNAEPLQAPRRTPIRIRKSKETIEYRRKEQSSNKGSRRKKKLPFKTDEPDEDNDEDDEEEEDDDEEERSD